MVVYNATLERSIRHYYRNLNKFLDQNPHLLPKKSFRSEVSSDRLLEVIIQHLPSYIKYNSTTLIIYFSVLLIALVTLGFVLLALLLICIILTCVRRKPRNVAMASGLSFLPQRVGNSGNMGTMDRRAMIQDTSSEDSRSETNTLPYVQVII